MKIGIITLLGNNYGNRLQNYAVQELLRNIDNSTVYTVPFEKNKIKYSEEGMVKFAKKKFVQLIIPYIFFSLSFSMIIWCGYHIPQLNKITDRIANGNIKKIPQIVFDVIFYRNVYFESLWFLYAMFILMIIRYWILEQSRISFFFFWVVAVFF